MTVSVVSKDEIWKHFSPKKNSLFSGSLLAHYLVQFSQYTHIASILSMTQLAGKKSASPRYTRGGNILGGLVFLFIF